jgi:hypothetical protein
VRIFAAKRPATIVVLAAAVVPRLAVLVYERASILTSYVEKSDTFARTFVASGTYGFVPGEPSAYTQPLYGFFLIPLYWIDRTWWLVGGAQIVVAAATSYVVYLTGRRFIGPYAGVAAALLTTLHPYLVWHDVHVNREILDQLLAASLFALVLLAARAGSVALAAAAGAVAGLAILGNSRLAALPLVLAAYLAVRERSRAVPVVLALLACCAVVLAPWVIRNRVDVGCFAITTDAHALWKANNVNTYSTLAHGKWIDDVPPLPGAPRLTPEYERPIYDEQHRVVHIDECAQMNLYEHATFRFWRNHPGEKLKLMAQATQMLWQPKPTKTSGGNGAATGTLKVWPETIWMVVMYALAIGGLFLVPRQVAAVALLFLLYNTAAAWVFAGATRYRVAFDVALAQLAGAAIERALSRARYTRTTPSTAAAGEN